MTFVTSLGLRWERVLHIERSAIRPFSHGWHVMRSSGAASTGGATPVSLGGNPAILAICAGVRKGSITLRRRLVRCPDCHPAQAKEGRVFRARVGLLGQRLDERVEEQRPILCRDPLEVQPFIGWACPREVRGRADGDDGDAIIEGHLIDCRRLHV